MRMLIVGSSGFIGQAIAANARARGLFVAGMSRDLRFSSVHEDAHLSADAADPTQVLNAVRAHAIDVVVDVIARTHARTGPLLEALDGQIARYVMVSSCDVYRNYGLLHRRETGTPDLDLLETSALRASRHPYRGSQPRAPDDPLRWHDDYDKIPIEDAVRSLAAPWTIARLPMVYGPGDRQARFAWALGAMLGGAGHIEAPTAWLDWTSTYSFAANVGAAVCLAAIHPAAAGSAVNIADSEPASNRQWFERLRAVTGWRGALVETDALWPTLQGLDLSVPLAVNAAWSRTTLDFTPDISIEASLAATTAAHRR